MLAEFPLLATGLFVLVLSILLGTSYPGITGGDSGELLVASCMRSVAHPPGYPLYTLLSHGIIRLWSTIPAARIGNVLSCVFGALASVCTYYTLVVYHGRKGHSISYACLSVFLHLSPTLHLYYSQAEVFALHHLLLSILLLVAVLYFKTMNDRYVYAGALLCGLSLSNQHTSILLILPLISFVFLQRPWYWIYNKNTLWIPVLVLVGLLPYLHLPLSSYRMEGWGDSTSLQGFLTHVLRKEYGTFSLAAQGTSEVLPSLTEKLTQYALNVYNEGLVLLLPLVVLSKATPFTQLLGSCFLLYVFVFHYLSNLDFRPLYLGVQMRFWAHPNLILGTLAATGLTSPIANLLLVPLAIYRLVSIKDYSTSNSVGVLGHTTLSSFPPQSLVFTNGDLHNNMLMYLHHCEGVSPTTDIIGLQQLSWDWWIPMHAHSFPSVQFPRSRVYHPHVGFTLAQLVRLNYDRRPVFICGPYKQGDNSMHESEFTRVPHGVCDRIVRDTPTLLSVAESSMAATPTPQQLGPYVYSRDSWEHVVYHDTATAYYSVFAMISQSLEPSLVGIGCKAGTWLLDMREFIEEEDVQDAVWRNLGIVCGMHGNHEEMMRAWKLYLTLQPGDQEIHHFVERDFNPYI